ncbi:chitin-binding domain-containing protein [Nocardia brasiliensis]|uniref:chitin-binding domain-containing protein n=1 Tax=Nocardia brasiliensis TaxID=37326 RepID=UPI00245910E5|nr:chitin-binding domain-containing protein [Nocardia brasiliensis]
MKIRTAPVCRAGVLVAGAATAALPSLGVALLTLTTMAAVDLPDAAGRGAVIRQYAVVPLEAGVDLCEEANKDEGYYADPDDDAVFYRCLDSANRRMATLHFRCLDQARYDAQRSVCVVRRPY